MTLGEGHTSPYTKTDFFLNSTVRGVFPAFQTHKSDFPRRLNFYLGPAKLLPVTQRVMIASLNIGEKKHGRKRP